MKALTGLLVAAALFLAMVPQGMAGHNHHVWKHGGYWGHHHRHYHHYRSEDIWTGIGIGLLTGVFVSVMTSAPPPRPRAVVYTTLPQPVVVLQQPVVEPMLVPEPIYDSTERILRQVVVTPAQLNLRFGPDRDSQIIGRLPGGSIVGVVGAAPEWLYVRTVSGQYGWIMTRYTRDLPQAGPVG